ncbi:hypothetical protein GIB67_020670 [Kingdonia uniflora]|uniref:Uncharacterized protein n=1 Tax=Kingdonia uniflora TaxID=39325 RepID=A0A7J7NK61_9MAGN|nr:hypothetical protein GIB67_020670 [Kingdonia uniflora]
MASTFGCAKADEVDLVGCLSPVIGVGDEEDIIAELAEWPRLKGARVEYPVGCSRFRDSIKQGGDYLHFLPDLAKEKKYRHLGDEVSLEYVQGMVKESRTDGFCCYLAQFDYGLTLHLNNLAKSVMNMIGACPAQLNYNFWEVILVCESLNERWAASGSESRITAKDFLEYYVVNYVTATAGAYLSSSSSRQCFFNLSSAERVWNDNLLWASGEYLQRSDEEPLELNNITITKGISCKVSRKESFIDFVSKEGTELEVVLKKLEINRFKRVASKDDRVRRSQAMRRMAEKTPGSMEENMLTPELNTPLKLARLNEMPNGPVDMATVSSIVVRNLTKRKAVKTGAASHSAMSDSVDDSSKRRKFTRALRGGVQLGLQDRSIELERWISQLEGKKNQFEESLTRERKVFQLELENEREAAALKLKEVRAERKLYHLRYTKAEILAFSKRNYEEKEIVDEEEDKEIEDGLNVAEKTVVGNQETTDQEIESLRLRVVDLEGLLKMGKNSSVDLQLSLKLEEAKSQVEDKTAILLSKDLALKQLISELAELKERAASSSQHDTELAEYHIRALNDEISDIKCNIRALNEQLLKREIDLDTARTNLAVSKANFKKLSSSIVGKDLELRNSAQIRNSLIARLDRLKADSHRLKERVAKSRADLAEVQAKNKNLVDNLARVRGNVRRAVQCDKEMNERINQLCGRISELEQELHVREIRYKKDLKLELDKRDGEIAYGEGSREMKEFHRQKEEDNKRAGVIHQSFKELVVYEQDKCDDEVLHQWKLSALAAFFVEEIKFLQVERDLMQDCIFGKTCVCKLDISSIDPIVVMDLGIGTTTSEKIARGKEIVTERAPEYMAFTTEIGGSLSAVSPTPTVGGRR